MAARRRGKAKPVGKTWPLPVAGGRGWWIVAAVVVAGAVAVIAGCGWPSRWRVRGVGGRWPVAVAGGQWTVAVAGGRWPWQVAVAGDRGRRPVAGGRWPWPVAVAVAGNEKRLWCCVRALSSCCPCLGRAPVCGRALWPGLVLLLSCCCPLAHHSLFSYLPGHRAGPQSPATEFRGAAKRRTRPGHRAGPQSPATEFRGVARVWPALFSSKIEPQQ